MLSGAKGAAIEAKIGGLVSQVESSAESSNKTSALRQWWTAPAGPRDVLAIAMPLIISTAFWSIQWFVDRLYLMWYSIDAMAAAMPAGMAQWALMCMPMGIASYANTFVAQYYGAGRKDRIGASVGQGVWVGIISTPLILFLSFALAPYVFSMAGYSDKVIQLEQEYFISLAWGSGAFVLGNAMGAYYTGRGLTSVVMVVQVIGTLVNIALDYALVFGVRPFPELGIVGAGLATAISNWVVVVIYAVMFYCDRDAVECGLSKLFVWDRELMWRLLRYGTPGALPMMIEAMAFSTVTFCVTGLGHVEGAATGLAFNVNAVAFIPVVGLSIATATLVGQHLGENRSDLAAKSTWNALGIAVVYTMFFALLYVLTPQLFLFAHETYAADAAEFASVKQMTVVLLRFVAVYCVFDAAQVVFVGALKGAGDTVFVLIATTLISGLGVFIGVIGQRYWGFGVMEWWSVLTGWLFVTGLVYCIRFQQGKWRKMRVIEEATPEAKRA